MRVLVLTLAALLTTTAAASAGGRPSSDRQAAFEKDFLKGSTDHHFGGVKMGQVCVAKARDRRLTAVCRGIVHAQATEVTQMRRFLRDWYDQDKRPGLDEMMREDVEELEGAPRGKPFDVMVSEMFIEHHRTQIADSEQCLDEAHHAALKALCREQIAMQRAEIRVFRAVIRHYG